MNHTYAVAVAGFVLQRWLCAIVVWNLCASLWSQL